MASLTPTPITTVGVKQTLAAATACGDRFKPSSKPEFIRFQNAGVPSITVTIPTTRPGGAAPVNSVLTSNANAGQAVINVTLGSKFNVGNQCTIVDSAGREYCTVLSVNGNAVTIDAAAGLVNNYTTARTATLWLGGADLVVAVAGSADISVNFDTTAHTNDFIDDDGNISINYSSATSFNVGLFQVGS
jgi:hypothetical protein